MKNTLIFLLAGAWLLGSCSKPESVAVKSAAAVPPSHADSLKQSQRLFDLAYSEYEPGHHDRALLFMDSAIAFDPDHAQAWQVKACCLAGLDRYVDARNAFDIAIRLKPDYRQAWWHRGCMHAVSGAVDSALSDLRHAIAIDSNVRSWPFQDDCWKSLRDNPKLLALTGTPNIR